MSRDRRATVRADAVMEALVVPSFSRAGCRWRSRLWAWEPPPAMEGRVVVVTGASSGIGLAAAEALAALGARAHLVCRDPGRAEQASQLVALAGRAGGRGGEVAGYDLADLAEAAQVQALGARLARRYPRVDALVHAAGSLSRRYRTGGQGTEITVAVHVLAPYMLTAALAGPLVAAQGRVVVVSSGGMYTQRFALPELEMGPARYRGQVAYARAKRAQVVLAHAWRERLGPAGVSAFAMHPGWVDTPGLAQGMPTFYRLVHPMLRTPAEGAATAVWLAAGAAPLELATSPGVVFFHDRAPRSESRLHLAGPYEPGQGSSLLQWCEQRTGVRLELPASGTARNRR